MYHQLSPAFLSISARMISDVVYTNPSVIERYHKSLTGNEMSEKELAWFKESKYRNKETV